MLKRLQAEILQMLEAGSWERVGIEHLMAALCQDANGQTEFKKLEAGIDSRKDAKAQDLGQTTDHGTLRAEGDKSKLET